MQSRNPGASKASLDALINWLKSTAPRTSTSQDPESLADLLSRLTIFRQIADDVDIVAVNQLHFDEFVELQRNIFTCTQEVCDLKIELLGGDAVVQPREGTVVDASGAEGQDPQPDKIDGVFQELFNSLVSHQEEATQIGGTVTTALGNALTNILGDGCGPMSGPGLLKPLPATDQSNARLSRVKVSNFWNPTGSDSVILWGDNTYVEQVRR